MRLRNYLVTQRLKMVLVGGGRMEWWTVRVVKDCGSTVYIPKANMRDQLWGRDGRRRKMRSKRREEGKGRQTR